MSIVISAAVSGEILEKNKDSLIVLLFDADFTDQSNIITDAENALLNSPELKEKILVGKVDVEENNDIALKYNVEAVPMVVCVHNIKAVKRINTLDPSKLVTIVQEVYKQVIPQVGVTSGGESQPQDVDPKQKFKEYLTKLVNRSSVMIFMKGEPTQPRCGFSKQLIELLGRYNIKYDTFDILLDEDVRQGLKEFSDWPTYPQIYVNGEFVGGLDILKQLHESGELESTLNPKKTE